MSKHTHASPDRLYAATDLYDPAEATKVGPRRTRTEKADQSRAIRALLGDVPSVVYAVQFPDGTVKIGCSGDLAERFRRFRSTGGVIVGFMAGDHDAEQAIHAELRASLQRGREWYYPTPEVLAVVNAMRDEFNLPHIAA